MPGPGEVTKHFEQYPEKVADLIALYNVYLLIKTLTIDSKEGQARINEILQNSLHAREYQVASEALRGYVPLKALNDLADTEVKLSAKKNGQPLSLSIRPVNEDETDLKVKRLSRDSQNSDLYLIKDESDLGGLSDQTLAVHFTCHVPTLKFLQAVLDAAPNLRQVQFQPSVVLNDTKQALLRGRGILILQDRVSQDWIHDHRPNGGRPKGSNKKQA